MFQKMKRHLVATTLAACAGLTATGATAADGYTAGRFGNYPLPQLQRFATEQVRTQGQSPEDYVVDKFQDHDIVLLGETPHQVRQNLEFLQALIPRLYAAGVMNLGYEMLRSEVQPQIDRLLDAPRYDEQLANSLILDWDHHFGGYQEYRDVLRIVWELNSKLPKGAPRFRVVGLDYWYMPLDWSKVRAGEKGTDEKVIKRNFGVRDRDMRWAQTIDDEILSKGGKALVFGGAGHTSTRFNWDRGFGTHHRTAGNLIYAYIGERSFRISLHGSEGIQEANMLEKLLGDELAAGRRFGVDLRAGTPLGDLPSSKAGYLGRSRAGTPAKTGNFTLSDVADGYVVLVPACEWKMARPIENFYTPDHVREIVRRIQIERGDRSATVTASELEAKARQEDARWRQSYETGCSRGG
jgi:hypothetical protein